MSILNLLRADAELDPDIGFSAPPAPLVPGSVLLTGATGFLGAYLLHELLDQTNATVHCLVRAADADAACSRLQRHLEHCGLWREDLAARIVALAGDLARPRLGLADGEYARLAESIDAVYHNGAWINAFLSYADLKAVNVEGTRAILRFAGTARTKPVHYVSTLALFFGSAHAGRSLTEQAIPVLDAGLKGGYKQTKWVAEQLVRHAEARGLPTAIYRPGRILGHSQTGMNANLQDILCTILKACVQLGKYPEVDTGIDVTPVDYVSRAIVHLSLSQEGPAFGRAFHLRNPQPVDWGEFMGMVRNLGYPLAGLPYGQWLEEIRQYSARHPGESFYRQLRLLMRSPIYLFSPDKPQYCGEATTLRLAEANIVCPRVERELMATYLGYFARCGFLAGA